MATNDQKIKAGNLILKRKPWINKESIGLCYRSSSESVPRLESWLKDSWFWNKYSFFLKKFIHCMIFCEDCFLQNLVNPVWDSYLSVLFRWKPEVSVHSKT